MDNRNDKPIGSMDVNNELRQLNQLRQLNHRLKQVTSQIVRLEQQKSRIETEIDKLKDLLVPSKGEGVPLSDEKITEKQPAGTILIVDDVKMMRMALRQTLRSGGYTVVEAENGIQALDILRGGYMLVEAENSIQMLDALGAESIDLVIADIKMPDMDGLELVKKIRATPKTADLPVIMCTSLKEKSNVIRAARLGVQGFLVKPISPKLVLAKVDKIFNGQKEYQCNI